MKKISVYRPKTIEEATDILSLHGTEAGVYAGGTDLLVRLKNRLKETPVYLVDIKKIDNLRYIKDDGQGGVKIGALTKIADRHVVIEKGHVVWTGTSAELAADRSVKEKYLQV